jgi:hypothetical protein
MSSGDTSGQNTAAIARFDGSNSPNGRTRKYTDFSDNLPAVVETDVACQQRDGGQDDESHADRNGDGNAQVYNASTVETQSGERKRETQWCQELPIISRRM